ncbi:MAG: hypothetical protein FWF67_07280 [Fibromonadales bacterium]|nr:hypothetical protein [Fibromonadales bacterium]
MKNLLILAALFLFSCGDSSVNIEGHEDSDNNSNSPGNPPPNNNNSGGNNNSVTPQQAANAVVLTLTYWQTKDTDIGGLDPKIYFKVTAYKDRKVASNNNSNTLLDENNIAATWTGSKKSSPVPFASQADSVIINAVVIEKDTFSDDDISPGYYVIFYPPFNDGRTGSYTLDYGSGLSKVSFNYQFIRQ